LDAIAGKLHAEDRADTIAGPFLGVRADLDKAVIALAGEPIDIGLFQRFTRKFAAPELDSFGRVNAVTGQSHLVIFL
jgi:hypothetical protein